MDQAARVRYDLSHESIVAFSRSHSSSVVDRDAELAGAADEVHPLQRQQLAGLAGRDLPAAEEIHHDRLARSLVEGLLLLEERGRLVVQHDSPHGFQALVYCRNRLRRDQRGWLRSIALRRSSISSIRDLRYATLTLTRPRA